MTDPVIAAGAGRRREKLCLVDDKARSDARERFEKQFEGLKSCYDFENIDEDPESVRRKSSFDKLINGFNAAEADRYGGESYASGLDNGSGQLSVSDIFQIRRQHEKGRCWRVTRAQLSRRLSPRHPKYLEHKAREPSGCSSSELADRFCVSKRRIDKLVERDSVSQRYLLHPDIMTPIDKHLAQRALR